MEGKYAASKYCGGTYCGNGEFDSLEAAFEFANDGFCDYVRITNMVNGQILKIRFTPDDEKLLSNERGNY